MRNYTKEEWADRVRSGLLPDVVKVNNIIYTMDSYDMWGKEISYSNESLSAGFTITTKDRYNNHGFNDTTVTYEKPGHSAIRTDITYSD